MMRGRSNHLNVCGVMGLSGGNLIRSGKLKCVAETSKPVWEQHGMVLCNV